MRKLIFIFLIFHVHIFNCTKIPKLLRCIDESCEDKISSGRIIKTVKPRYGNLEILKSPSMVNIRGKNVNSQNTLWLVDQEGYYGFVDLSFIKEIRSTVTEDLTIVQNPYDTKIDETEESDDSTNEGGLFSKETVKNIAIPMENDETENFSELNSKVNDNKETTINIKKVDVSNDQLNNNITTLNSQNNDKLESTKENINANINNENAQVIESSNSNKGIVDPVNIHNKKSSNEISNSKKVKDPVNKDSNSPNFKSEVKRVKNVKVDNGEKLVKKIDSKIRMESREVVEDVKVNNLQKEQPIVKHDNKDDKPDEKGDLPNINQQNSNKHTKNPIEVIGNSSQNSENDSKIDGSNMVKIGSIEASQTTIGNEKQISETQKITEQDHDKKTKTIDSSKVNLQIKPTASSKPIEIVDMKLEKAENQLDNSASENPGKEIPPKSDLKVENRKIQSKSTNNSNSKQFNPADSTVENKKKSTAKEESIQKQDTKNIPKEPIKTLKDNSKYPVHSKSDQKSSESAIENSSNKIPVIQSKEINETKTDQSVENSKEIDNQSNSNLPDEKSSESTIENSSNKISDIQSKEINESQTDQSVKSSIEIDNQSNSNLPVENSIIKEIDKSKSDQKSSESTIENSSNKISDIQSKEINESKTDQSVKNSIEIDNQSNSNLPDEKSSESIFENSSNKISDIQSKEINESKTDQSVKNSKEVDNQSNSNLPLKISTNENEGVNSKPTIENNNVKRKIKQNLDSDKSVKLIRDIKIPNVDSMKGDPWLDNSGRPAHDIGNEINQFKSPLIKLIMKIDILSQLGIKYVASKLGFDSSSKLNQFTNHWLQMPLEGFVSIFLLFSVLFITAYAPKLLKSNRDWKAELIRQSQLMKELELNQQTTEEVRHKLTVQNHNFEKVIDEYKQKINEIQEDSAKNRKTVILEIEKIKKSNESNVKNLTNDLTNKIQQCQLLENDLLIKTNTIENLEEDKREMELQFDNEKSQLEVELSENKRELNRIGCLHEQLKHSFQQLSMETEGLKARIEELNEEINSRNDSYCQLEKSFEHLKVFEGLNYEEFNERKSIYLELTQTKQRLESSERNLEQLNATLQLKTQLIQQLEHEEIAMKQTVNRCETEKSLAIQEKEAAEMKLQVLTEYFKSKEVEMAKTLGHQVIESTQSMDQLDFLKHRIRNLESENEELTKSGQKLKSEIKEAQTFATKCKTEANEEINRLFLRNVNLERNLQTEKEENKKLRTKLSHYCGPTPPRNQASNSYNHNKDRPPSRQSGISEPVGTFVPLSFIPFTSPQSPIPNTNQFSGRNSVNSKKSNNT